MDQIRRNQIGSLHDQQRHRASIYKPTIPEIPRAHGCAGNCSLPPPSPPVSNKNKLEGFRGAAKKEQMWWMVLGGATVVFALLCLPHRR